MAWTLTTFSAALFVAALITGALTYLAWCHRDEPAAVPATVLLGAMSGWALTEGIRVGFRTFGTQLLWYRIGFFFVLAIPAAWFMFALAYAGYEQRLTGRVLALLLVEPLTFALLVWTNSLHHLVWTNIRLITQPVPHLVRDFAIGYYVHITYVYVLISAGILLLLRIFQGASRIYRRQTGLLLVGALLPFTVNIAFTLGLLPVPELEITPLTFAVSGIVFGIALFKFELLNLTPVARAKLTRTLGSGLIVVNNDGQVKHLNETATEVFPKAAIGASLIPILDVDTVDDLHGRTFETANAEKRFYDTHTSELRDFRGRVVGTLIALRDVTVRREYEQRLEVANRLLRHNLRNDTAKLIGWADQIQALTEDEDVATLGDRIETVAWELSNLGEKAQYLESALESDGTLTNVHLTGVLEDIVADLQTKWPAAEISMEVPETVYVQAQDRELLEVACRNVIENSIKHNDADTPYVRLRVACVEEADAGDETETGERIVLEVADNGPGIPDIERETIQRGTETSLKHGSGLGLWITSWIVAGAGGELSFEENEPRGSIVKLELNPPAESGPSRPLSGRTKIRTER